MTLSINQQSSDGPMIGLLQFQWIHPPKTPPQAAQVAESLKVGDVNKPRWPCWFPEISHRY